MSSKQGFNQLRQSFYSARKFWRRVTAMPFCRVSSNKYTPMPWLRLSQLPTCSQPAHFQKYTLSNMNDRIFRYEYLTQSGTDTAFLEEDFKTKQKKKRKEKREKRTEQKKRPTMGLQTAKAKPWTLWRMSEEGKAEWDTDQENVKASQQSSMLISKSQTTKPLQFLLYLS